MVHTPRVSRTEEPARSDFRLRFASFAWAALLSLSACSCASSGPFIWVKDFPAESASSHPDETISPGDMINVRVFTQDAISTRSRVRRDGLFSVPLIGDVAVAGKHPSALGKELEDKLRPFVNTPHVTVTIDESQVHIHVVGEVHHPGTFALDAPSGVLAALAAAGGLTEFAVESRVFVLRADHTGRIHRIRFDYDDLTRGEPKTCAFHLQSGDSIVVE